VKEYELELANLDEKYKELIEEKLGKEDGFKLQEMMHTMTPRPNWRRTGAVKQILVDCSIFSRTDTSAQSVEKLLQGFISQSQMLSVLQARVAELEGHKEDPAQHAMSGWSWLEVTNSYITCMGLGEDVPMFLRYNGQVRNLKMRKGDAERHIRNIWSAKAEHDMELAKAGKPRSEMATFFHNYVKSKFNNIPKNMAEWCYNLVVALKQNHHGTNCSCDDACAFDANANIPKCRHGLRPFSQDPDAGAVRGCVPR
jgi:hypothetical protein